MMLRMAATVPEGSSVNQKTYGMGNKTAPGTPLRMNITTIPRVSDALLGRFVMSKLSG